MTSRTFRDASRDRCLAASFKVGGRGNRSRGSQCMHNRQFFNLVRGPFLKCSLIWNSKYGLTQYVMKKLEGIHHKRKVMVVDYVLFPLTYFKYIYIYMNIEYMHLHYINQNTLLWHWYVLMTWFISTGTTCSMRITSRRYISHGRGLGVFRGFGEQYRIS